MLDWVGSQLEAVYRMHESGQEFLLVLGLYVGMILVERLIVLFRRQPWNEKSAVSNIAIAAIGTTAGILVTGVAFVAAYGFLYQFRLFDLQPNIWWAWIAVFVIHEFCYFLDHLLAHRIGFFWVFHQVHHGSNELDLTVASRGSVLDGIMQWTYWVIAPLLGVPLLMLIVVKFFTNLWGIFNHTRMVHRLPDWMENWLATPANHRVHHGRQAKYLDRNYGQVTVVFDRLFGTFQREEEEPDYGLVTRVEGYNPITHHLVGFRWMWSKLRAAPDWRSRVGYLVRPPGWSHDGAHETAEVMRGEPYSKAIFTRRQREPEGAVPAE